MSGKSIVSLFLQRKQGSFVLVTNGFSEEIPLVTRSEPDPWNSQMYTKSINLIEVL